MSQMVFKASTAHAPLVAENIIASVNGGKQKPYKGAPEAILVTLGPKGGRVNVPYLGGIVLGDWMASKAKSADLFVAQTRTTLGYAPEKTGSSASTVLLGAALLAVPVAYALYLNGLLSV